MEALNVCSLAAGYLRDHHGLPGKARRIEGDSFQALNLVAPFKIYRLSWFGLGAGIRQVIKAVGGVEILPRHKVSCHCGAVELVLDLSDGIVDPRRCDCSICKRKGAIVASVGLAGIRVVKGGDVLSLYQFNTNTAKHYLSSICGIYTHHQRRSNPEEYGFNVSGLEGVNPLDIPNVLTIDGTKHPADRRELCPRFAQNEHQGMASSKLQPHDIRQQ